MFFISAGGTQCMIYVFQCLGYLRLHISYQIIKKYYIIIPIFINLVYCIIKTQITMSNFPQNHLLCIILFNKNYAHILSVFKGSTHFLEDCAQTRLVEFFISRGCRKLQVRTSDKTSRKK